MSYTRKAKNGYYGVAIYKDSNGKRKQKSAGFFKLKRDAIDASNQLEKELDQRNINLADISLVDYYERWRKTYKATGLSDSSIYRYKMFKKVIKDYFKDARLADIRRSDYQLFINWYGKNHAMSSVSKLNGAMRSCISYAIDDDIITKDFTHNAKINANSANEYRVEYLSIKELETLIKAVMDNLDHHNTSRYLILTAIYTGMRKSEIQALTWKDIDFIHSTISINKSWDENKKVFKPTKTKTSNRTIKVNRQLLHCLEDLKANGSTMVFMNCFKTIPTSNALNKCLRSIMKSAGIQKQGFHFHSLRHVHVAYLLSKGVDIYAISKRLGHSDITVTLKKYSYFIDEFKAKNDTLIIDKLAELI